MNGENLIDYLNNGEFRKDLIKGIKTKIKRLNLPKSAEELRKVGAKKIYDTYNIWYHFDRDILIAVLGYTDKGELLTKDTDNLRERVYKIPLEHLQLRWLIDIANSLYVFEEWNR